MTLQTASHGDARIRGRVERVYFSGPTFSAGSLLTPSGDSVKFAGKLYARENQPLVLKGRWGRHPKYGRQFQVEW